MDNVFPKDEKNEDHGDDDQRLRIVLNVER